MKDKKNSQHPVADFDFEAYNSRQLVEISAQRNTENAQKVQASGHFVYQNQAWVPQAYEGFAIISMLNENPRNEALTQRLSQIQTELSLNLQPKHSFYQLPAESFHQTVANTLSANRFELQIASRRFEHIFPQMVNDAFAMITPPGNSTPIKMKMVGLSIFGTAIGMLGVFDNPYQYLRITNFRTAFYADTVLAGLDVKMTRPFIGHITLAYVESNLNTNQREHLGAVVNELNEDLAREDLYFNIVNTGLRRYNHLAQFNKADDFPVFKL